MAPSFDAGTLAPFIEDGGEMLKDVQEEEEHKEDVLRKAADVSEYITTLRGRMESDLNGFFARFQKELDKEMAAINSRKK